MVAKRATTKSEWQDPDDAPELTREWFEHADVMKGDTVISHGKPGRPKLDAPKQAVSLRLDADVVARFRAGGRGWQSRINTVLREHLGRRRKG
jgi:uncharacterized protein (DUF4415 family)